MLFEGRFWEGIRDGSVTVTFRRWKRPQATAGRTNRTAAGILQIDSVNVVEEGSISNAEAIAAGYESAAALRTVLRDSPDVPLYRIRFHLASGGDPREDLANTAEITEAERLALQRRLGRLDAASRTGPWTREVLRLIRERPAVRAADLAAQLDRETLSLKADVRKLKSLGLTFSLEIGYRLSPRGESFLAEELAPEPGPRVCAGGDGTNR